MKTKNCIVLLISFMMLSVGVFSQDNSSENSAVATNNSSVSKEKPGVKQFPNFGKEKARLNAYDKEYNYSNNYLSDYIKPAKDFTAAKLFLDSLKDNYDGYWGPTASNAQFIMMHNMYNETVKNMSGFDNMIKTKYTNANELGGNELDKMLASAEKLKTAKTDTTAWKGKLGGYFVDVEFYVSALKMMNGEDDLTAKNLHSKMDDTKKQIRDLKLETQKTINADKSAAYAKNQAEQKKNNTTFTPSKVTVCPVDIYTGADKGIVLAKVKSTWDCSKYTIVKIYITQAQWEREKGKRWDDTQNAEVYFDNSFLNVDVVCKRTDGTGDAYLAQYSLDLNNINGIYSNELLCDYVEDKEISMSIVK